MKQVNNIQKPDSLKYRLTTFIDTLLTYLIWLEVSEPEQYEKVVKIASFSAGALTMLTLAALIHFIF